MSRCLLLIFCFSFHTTFAQNTRINDKNDIGWAALFFNGKLDKRWSLHLEYQWRRDNFVHHWQQGLLKAGINYQFQPKILLRLGYAWAETYAYGDFPLNPLGRDFTEHRAFQMLNLTDKPGRMDLAHRFMLEQRWIGRYSSPEIQKEDEFIFVNRLRYMFRAQYPFKGNTLDNKELYGAFFNEILIGFGKNINENIFDQNRLGLLLGYRFSKQLRLEGGYLLQVLQLGREITLPGETAGRNVFQYNSGLVFNTYWNVDWTKK